MRVIEDIEGGRLLSSIALVYLVGYREPMASPYYNISIIIKGRGGFRVEKDIF